MSLAFPFNYGAACAANFVIIIFIARILIERRLKLESALLYEASFKWDIDKTAQEYIELLKNEMIDEGENAKD